MSQRDIATYSETRAYYRSVETVCQSLLVDVAMILADGVKTDAQRARLAAMIEKLDALKTFFHQDNTAKVLRHTKKD